MHSRPASDQPQTLAAIRLDPAEIAISSEEILADLLYPEAPVGASGRRA